MHVWFHKTFRRDYHETHNVRCRAITYASPGTIQFSRDTSHPVSEDAHPRCNVHSSDRRAYREIRLGTRGRGNSDKVGRRGLVPRPVRLSTETQAINKAPSAQLWEQLHLCVPVQLLRNCAVPKLRYLVLTANTGTPDNLRA